MTLAETILQELELEAATTRRVLERIPTDQLSWKPAPRSRTLGELGQHIAENPGTICTLAAQNPGVVPAGDIATVPASTDELLATLDAGLVQARQVLSSLPDSAMHESWRLTAGGHELLSMPRIAFLRTVLFNHWYHHRGQLSVYLRELNVPVPSIYGPSADENPFAAG